MVAPSGDANWSKEKQLIGKVVSLARQLGCGPIDTLTGFERDVSLAIDRLLLLEEAARDDRAKVTFRTRRRKLEARIFVTQRGGVLCEN
jgi:hypothetical protein